MGAFFGGLAGLVTGLVIGANKAAECEAEASSDGFCGIATPAYSILGLMGGAAIGAVVGNALIKIDRWQEVPLDQFRVGIAPQRDGRLGIGFSVTY